MSNSMCFKVDLVSEQFNGKDRKKTVQLITNIICALLNTAGGQLDVGVKNFDKKAIHELIRTIEQRFTNILGGLKTSESIVQRSVSSERITFVIAALKYHLCTLNYNLFLPNVTGVQSIEPNEPVAAIERIVEGKRYLSHRMPTKLGSHIREFKSDEQIEDNFDLTSNIVCKPIIGQNVKKEMTNKQSKFKSQVSALANDTGGHIYHGIKNGKVTGVLIQNYSESKLMSIASEVAKVLGEKMVWGCHETPMRGREWEIYFEPVKDEHDNIINKMFVIIVSIAPYKGGVFVDNPDCYHVVEGKTEQMTFNTWKKKFLDRRTSRLCYRVDEHVSSLKDDVHSVLRISSAHNKAGSPDI